MNTKLKSAIFPGSFDPLTLGHVDIVSRALKIFDKVVVAILDNPEKKPFFTPAERLSLISKEFEEYGDRVEVVLFTGLLVEFAEERGVGVIIRGLRAISDFDYEAQMALMNRTLSASIETFFLMSSERFSYVSSTLVKQIAPYGGDTSGLVPPIIAQALSEKVSSK